MTGIYCDAKLLLVRAVNANNSCGLMTLHHSGEFFHVTIWNAAQPVTVS